MPTDHPAGDLDVAPDLRDRLRSTRGFVFDMDGTLVLGDRRNHGLRPLPGALDLVGWLDQRGVPWAVVTNGTTRTPEHYAQVLRELGFAVTDDRLLTPASGAIEALRADGARKVVVLGHEGLSAPLRAAGMEVVEASGRPRVDAVVVGWFPDFTLPPLEAACHAVWAGARVYSASQSLFFATAEGRTLGTSRAICGMIEAVTGVGPEVVGKPSTKLLHAATARLGLAPGTVAVVGDDPALEIPMAHAGGSLAISVDTGVGATDEDDEPPPEHRPHLALAGVDDLLALLVASRD